MKKRKWNAGEGKDGRGKDKDKVRTGEKDEKKKS
jgi:hypothetical protein